MLIGDEKKSVVIVQLQGTNPPRVRIVTALRIGVGTRLRRFWYARSGTFLRFKALRSEIGEDDNTE